MKRTAAVIMAATFALSAPLVASAAEHGSSGTMSMGKMIHTETVDGVKATFRLIDLKERMKGMAMPAGMKDTHHLMIMFTDAKTGKMLSEGEVKVKIVGPDKTEQVKTMMGMSGGFGSDVNLSVKGKYGIMTKFLLKGGKVMSSKFWYEVK
ncbi:MAG: hypothetical protein PHD01_04380 [Geobacteraceae bacterium]|nr:hypothetical protein [Geobacteraceae bacterium]